jgi:hypothetical protein|tara:strand:+ start:490 stop:705 length:216 start_codon:yes stop_codon:yes gene_type:complete
MPAIVLDYYSSSGTMTLDICNEGVDPSTDYFVSDYCAGVPQMLANLSCFGTGRGAKVQNTLSGARGKTEDG